MQTARTSIDYLYVSSHFMQRKAAKHIIRWQSSKNPIAFLVRRHIQIKTYWQTSP